MRDLPIFGLELVHIGSLLVTPVCGKLGKGKGGCRVRVCVLVCARVYLCVRVPSRLDHDLARSKIRRFKDGLQEKKKEREKGKEGERDRETRETERQRGRQRAVTHTPTHACLHAAHTRRTRGTRPPQSNIHTQTHANTTHANTQIPHAQTRKYHTRRTRTRPTARLAYICCRSTTSALWVIRVIRVIGVIMLLCY